MKDRRPDRRLVVMVEQEHADYLFDRAAREGGRSMCSLLREIIERERAAEQQQQTAAA